MARSFPCILLALFVLAGCGPVVDEAPGGCGPATCGGCCSNQGTCVTGNNIAFCGAGGSRCDVCVTGQECKSGTCVTRGAVDAGKGGGSGGGGGSACVPSDNARFCADLGVQCGAATGLDNCGTTRMVTQCGSCNAPKTCSSMGVCSCAPESDAQLCTRWGRNCGTVNGKDSCAQSRAVSCGTCNVSGESCGAGGTPGVCSTPVCKTELDSTFCARYGRDCGTFTAVDNCNSSRTRSCGSCSRPQTCGGGGEEGQCGCTPETDSDFCARLGTTCGSAAAKDNCGVTRSVATCGSCVLPETCGAVTPRTCGCAPETDAAFCARLGFWCGSASGLDTCGKPRSVASCGACAAGTTCGLPLPGACGVSGILTPGSVCTDSGWCVDFPRPYYGEFYDVHALASNDIWAVGSDGALLHFDGASWSGRFGEGFTARRVWAASPNDVWVLASTIGATLLLRGDTTGFHTVRRTTGNQSMTDLIGFASNDVWFTALDGLWRWDGTAFSMVAGPPSPGFAALWGTSATNLFTVSGLTISHYDGATWSVEVTGGYTFSAIHGSPSGDVWAVGKWVVYHRLGPANWVTKVLDTATFPDLQLSRVFVKSPSDVWLMGTSPAYNDEPWPELFHFDGTAWSPAGGAGGVGKLFQPAFAMSTAPGLDAIAVGHNGLISTLTGSTWSTGLGLNDSGRWRAPTLPLAAIHGNGANVWAVGRASYSLGDAGWARRLATANSYTAVQVLPADKVWLGRDRGLSQVVDGGAVPFGPTTSMEVRSISGSSTDALINDVGGVRTFDGGVWALPSTPASGSSSKTFDVFTLGGSLAWAVGEYGVMRKTPAGAWEIDPSWSGGAARAVWASASDDLWVLTPTATWRKTASSWSSFGVVGRELFGLQSGKVLVVGDEGLAVTIDTQIARLPLPVSQGLTGAWFNGTKTWVTSQSGAIFTR